MVYGSLCPFRHFVSELGLCVANGERCPPRQIRGGDSKVYTHHVYSSDLLRSSKDQAVRVEVTLERG